MNYYDELNSDFHISQRFKLTKIDNIDQDKILQKITDANFIFVPNENILYQLSQSKIPDIQQLIISSYRKDFFIQDDNHITKCSSFIKKLQNKNFIDNQEYYEKLLIEGFGNLAINFIENGSFIDYQGFGTYIDNSLNVVFSQSDIQYDNKNNEITLSLQLIENKVFKVLKDIYFPMFVSFVQQLNDINIQKLLCLTEQRLDLQISHLQKRKICINQNFQQFSQQLKFQKFNYALQRQNNDQIEEEIIEAFNNNKGEYFWTSLQVLEDKMNEANKIAEEIQIKEDKIQAFYEQRAKLIAQIEIMEKEMRNDSKKLEHKLQVCSRLEHYREKYLKQIERQSLNAHQKEIEYYKKEQLSKRQINLEDVEYIKTGYFEQLLNEQENEKQNEQMVDIIQDEVQLNNNYNNQQKTLQIDSQKQMQENNKINNDTNTQNIIQNNKRKRTYRASSITDKQWQQLNQLNKGVKKAKFEIKCKQISAELTGN